MRLLPAILFTLCLLAICWVISALVYFDLSWIFILSTSLWAAIDSSKLELRRCKLANACRPVMAFAFCWLLWIFMFPAYLWVRHQIRSGQAVLKEKQPEEAVASDNSFRKLLLMAGSVAAWFLVALVGLKFVLLVFGLEESWRGEKAWVNYRQAMEAKGQKFNWAEFIPPPVADSQNVFSAPQMAAWFVMHRGKEIITDDLVKLLDYTKGMTSATVVEVKPVTQGTQFESDQTDSVLRLNDALSGSQARDLIRHAIGPFLSGARVGLPLIAGDMDRNHSRPPKVILEASTNPAPKVLAEWFGAPDHLNPLTVIPEGTNSYRLITSVCSATDYLRWSGRFQGEFDLMREAFKRPYVRLPGDYSSPITSPYPNLLAIRAVEQTLAQRAQCYLLLGQAGHDARRPRGLELGIVILQ